MHRAKAALIRRHVQAQNFARRAFGHDLKWTAADFAIGREPLERHACIHHNFECLPAKRALDVFGNFHGLNSPDGG